ALAAAEQFLLSRSSPESKVLLDYALQALRQTLHEEADVVINSSQPANDAASSPEASETTAEADPLEDLIKEFLIESYENLDQLDRDLVTLEQDPSSQSTLASIFRTIHTIKGTCGFFGFAKLESVTHVGESLLSRLREGKLRLTSDITTGLL